MRILLSLLLALPLVGCQSNSTPPIRTATYELHNEDPAGLYVVELLEEEFASIEEDVVVDVMGNSVGVDKVFLRNAVISFRHKGVTIDNGHYDEFANPDRLHYWMVRRTEQELWYYIGTRQQYAKLERDRLHVVGVKMIQL